MTEMTAEGYAVRKALGLAPEADGADVLAEIGWLQQSATPPPAGSGECQECDGTGTTYSAGYYVPGEQFTEPPTGPDMCESCNGTGRIPAPPPAPSAERGELAEWADALEANAQDMRDGFEASEPDIRNAASAIRAHRCRPSAATAPQENAHMSESFPVDRDALVRAFMAAECVHSDRWRYLPERADWAEAEAMADVALAEIERQRREQP